MNAAARQEFQELLTHTSRSFSLGILNLAQPLQDDVCLSYLLCRIFDTYEDSCDVDAAHREACLDYSLRLLHELPEGDVAFRKLLEDWDRIHDFEVWESAPKVDVWEKKLLRAGKSIWMALGELPRELRRIFSECLLDMAVGMKDEVQKRHVEGDRSSRTLNETDHYCYIVAGTVGLLLTRLFRYRSQHPQGDLKVINEEAIGFGKALQLVNVLKDFHKDWQAGRCYWPHITLPEKSGLDLPPTTQLKEVFEELRQLFETYIQSAEKYLKRLESGPRDVYFFCAFPLEMAKSTISEGLRDMSWLSQRSSFKVSRLQVAKILSRFEPAS